MATNKNIYIAKYNKEKYKMYAFRIKKTDFDIIKKLENVPNKNRYIRDLIVEDIRPNVLTLKEIRTKIKPVMEKHNIKNVYLFGSYSRGEATRNSDVDLYCDRGDVDTLWKFSAFIDELEEALNKKVDVVTIGSEMHPFFKKQLEEEMIKLPI